MIQKKHASQRSLCRGSGLLVLTAIGIVLFSLLWITADRLLRIPSQGKAAEMWMNSLALSTPALWPAGTPQRHPETVHPAVDMRYCMDLEASP